MRNHTDSHIVEYNDDGSRTETSVVTYEPVSLAKQALAVTGLIALCVSPVIPLVAISMYEKWEERREARKEAKADLKSV